MVSVDVGDKGRSLLRRSRRASSADWASRAPAMLASVARLAPHLIGLLAERPGKQAEQGPPALKRLADLVDRLGRRKARDRQGLRRPSEMIERAAAARPSPKLLPPPPATPFILGFFRCS